jgi:hypothetical protein
MPTPFLPLTLDSFDGKPLDSRASMDGESHRALVQMTLRASVRRSGGARFHCQVRDAWFISVGVVRLFAGYRLHNLIPRRVTGAWWPPRSSKPLAVRISDRGRFDSYPLRLISLQAEIFKGGDHHVARADFEADLAFIVCGVSF